MEVIVSGLENKISYKYWVGEPKSENIRKGLVPQIFLDAQLCC